MERRELILGIVDAERRAKQITSEAIAQRKGLDGDLKQAIETMRERYFTRAQARIDKVRLTETEAAGEQIKSLDEKRAQMLDKIESSYEKSGESWVDTIFSLVIGRTEI